jgi:hypothetical protein
MDHDSFNLATKALLPKLFVKLHLELLFDLLVFGGPLVVWVGAELVDDVCVDCVALVVASHFPG